MKIQLNSLDEGPLEQLSETNNLGLIFLENYEKRGTGMLVALALKHETHGPIRVLVAPFEVRVN